MKNSLIIYFKLLKDLKTILIKIIFYHLLNFKNQYILLIFKNYQLLMKKKHYY